MVISITASTTTCLIGKQLPEQVLSKTIEACDRALDLDSAKKKVLDVVESRMNYFAPTVSTVGSAVAGSQLNSWEQPVVYRLLQTCLLVMLQ
jgi:U4/U6 small nuclear ribonucleoprotein PRP31